MLDRLLSLFRCRHRQMMRPPTTLPGETQPHTTCPVCCQRIPYTLIELTGTPRQRAVSRLLEWRKKRETA